MNTPIIICIFELALVPNFNFDKQFWFFGPKISKRYFQSKTEKVNITNELCIFELVLEPNFNFNWQFLIYGTNFPKKSISCRKRKKIEHHYWILLVRITLVTKFQLKLTNFDFWKKFSQEGYFLSRREKVNITIKLCILKLV